MPVSAAALDYNEWMAIITGYQRVSAMSVHIGSVSFVNYFV